MTSFWESLPFGVGWIIFLWMAARPSMHGSHAQALLHRVLQSIKRSTANASSNTEKRRGGHTVRDLEAKSFAYAPLLRSMIWPRLPR
uniref:Putative secreted protein n=1 Tax=Anopheles marajoara TaxID=58244 RepID=A0A2M4CA99_9DIPT